MSEELEYEVIKFLKNRGAKKISIFGSYVRGETTTESDLDIIVEFEKILAFWI